MALRKLSLLSLSLTMILAACNLGGANSQPPPVEVTTASPSSGPVDATPVEVVEGQSQFRDERAGFTFNYPEGWYVLEANVDDQTVMWATTLTSYDFNRQTDGRSQGVPEGEFKVDVVVSTQSPNPTLDLIRQRFAEMETNLGLVDTSEEMTTLASGFEAVIFRGDGGMGGPFVTIGLIMNGLDVEIGGAATSEEFIMLIANSLRPL